MQDQIYWGLPREYHSFLILEPGWRDGKLVVKGIYGEIRKIETILARQEILKKCAVMGKDESSFERRGRDAHILDAESEAIQSLSVGMHTLTQGTTESLEVEIIRQEQGEHLACI